MSTREIDQRSAPEQRALVAPAPVVAGAADDSEDKVLTVAFKRGEKGAYQAIHDRYAQRVHGVCRRMLLHPEDAEEAAQESFLRVYQALGRFNGRYLLGPWITRITTNVCLDHLRARGRRPVDLVPVEILDVQANGVADLDPQEINVRRSEGRRVHKLLESLPPLYRAAIVLRDFEGLSYAEVAAALQITEPQTKALIHRARQAFKRSWSSILLALPLRFVNRLRRLDPSSREQSGTTAASVQHTGEMVGNAVHAASSCSTLVQQCGQMLADKVAPVFAAGAVVIGAGAATASQPSHVAPPPAAVSTPDGAPAEPLAAASSFVEGSAWKPHRPGSKDERSEAVAPATEEPVAAPPAPAETTPPAAEPTEEPAPEAPTAPADSGGSGGNGTPTPSASPTPTPPPPVPAGFTFGFDLSQPAASPACACAGPTQVQSSAVGVTTAGIERLDQVLTGSVSVDGAPTYGLWLDHQSPSGTNHTMDFRIYTNEGGYFYSASGTLTDRALMDWNGWRYTYRGTYRLGSRPGSTGEVMTASGSYTLVVTASWAENRIVSTEFSAVDGG